MKYYVIRSYDNSLPVPVEYWQGGTRWTTDRQGAVMFPSWDFADDHIETMNWRKRRQAMGLITVEEVDTDHPEFDVEIIRTEKTRHVVRVRAQDEYEAKDIVYKQDCNNAYESVFEEAESEVQTQYYATEV